MVAAALQRRVGLYGIGDYRGMADAAAPPALVIGFGNVSERAIDPAVAAVADLLSFPPPGRSGRWTQPTPERGSGGPSPAG